MVSSRVVRVLAPNPSPMTLDGTNTYLVIAGTHAIAIDPGPADAAHVERIVAVAREHGARIDAIAVTHGHPDHAPGAALLHALVDAPIVAHAAATYRVDRTVSDGERIVAGDVTLEVIEAPGHAGDHVVFRLASEAALFTGDVIVGRGTVVIAPPNGDMRAYQTTLKRLRDDYADARTIYGGHGDKIEAPARKIEEYIAHRAARETELLAALEEREHTIPELVARIYRNVATALWPAAARQMLAYAIALEREGRVASRILDREPTPQEAAILNPDLSQLVDAESVAVAAAELGIERRVSTVESYRRVS